MKPILNYLRDYYIEVDKRVLWTTTLLVALLIFLNFRFGVEEAIRRSPGLWMKLAGFFLLYAFLSVSTYWIRFYFVRKALPNSGYFYLLLFAAPLVFAFKIGYEPLVSQFIRFPAGPWRSYWDLVLDFPLRFGFLILLVTLLWKAGRMESPVAGWRGKGWHIRPYLILLGCMIPLLALAATRPDFQAVYPKMQKIAFLYPHTSQRWPWQFLFELAYGSDFLSIETFFRGFLVLAFARYVGRDAILPMAAFYCSIHFGKPLFECISSFPGGIILGIIVYRTRSIWGGLVVHLGIAWLMEIAGYAARHVIS